MLVTHKQMIYRAVILSSEVTEVTHKVTLKTIYRDIIYSIYNIVTCVTFKNNISYRKISFNISPIRVCKFRGNRGNKTVKTGGACFYLCYFMSYLVTSGQNFVTSWGW